EVVVVSIGTNDVQQQLRTALAMGADRAIHVEANEEIQPLHAARLLKAVTERENAELVILGKQAIDDDANQTGQMLAALLDRPQATFASKIDIQDGKASVTREVDAGLETIEIDLPAIVTTDLRLNEPRFVKMPDIIKAKKKPLGGVPAGELGVTEPPMLETQAYAAPVKRSGGRKVETVAELVDALKQKGLI